MKIYKNAVVPPHELSLETSTVLEETVELLLADIKVINSWICSNTSTVFLYLCCSWNKKRPAGLLKVRGQTKKSCFYSQLLRLRLKMSKNIKKQNRSCLFSLTRISFNIFNMFLYTRTIHTCSFVNLMQRIQHNAQHL